MIWGYVLILILALLARASGTARNLWKGDASTLNFDPIPKPNPYPDLNPKAQSLPDLTPPLTPLINDHPGLVGD